MGDPRYLELTGERTLPDVPEENYWFRRHEAAYRLAARAVPRGARIVDAGCGEGYGTALLARRGKAAGLDLDGATVAHAAARYGPRFARADLCRPPLRRGSVDAVLALQVLEHLVCPQAFLATCRDALRPGGVLVLSTPNRLTFPAGLNPSHVYEYDPAELRGLLGSLFAETTVFGIAHGPRLRALDRALGEPVPRRLVRSSYRELRPWIRAALRAIRARDFRSTAEPEGALDLVALCPLR
ncbi:MAG TPA: class I SAM-dependent methyltransferase [Actinomycetota bacterium]|nr:class I SAM-dependent methyltransferase [Actinomycetota bacterium]